MNENKTPPAEETDLTIPALMKRDPVAIPTSPGQPPEEGLGDMATKKLKARPAKSVKTDPAVYKARMICKSPKRHSKEDVATARALLAAKLGGRWAKYGTPKAAKVAKVAKAAKANGHGKGNGKANGNGHAARDYTVKPTIPESNASAARLCDRIHAAAKGDNAEKDLKALLAEFQPCNTYYRQAHRYATALLERARAR